MTSLAGLVDRFTASLRSSGPYRAPDEVERATADALAAAIADGSGPADVERLAAALGFTTTSVAGRVALVADPQSPRAWGLVVLPRVPPGVLVEVPHPAADLRTEQIGVAVAEGLDDALYLQAGAHRAAGAPADARRRSDCPADVAHRPDSVFARLAAGLVVRLGLPQVQLHGFADRPDLDAVVSPGAATGSVVLEETVARLTASGERVRRGGEPGCEDLSGTRNVQGRLAARHGTVFVHLELSRSMRRSARRRELVAEAVTAAVRSAT
ncbi:hypothetical protein [Actinomycetospora sp. NBRC 106378]|uniref:hypothetical protein n=1 Tax=Actinomycetospora sp. NBRC 106378 TaxID=3032208 RepID=UPI0024A05F70|nr:hypothetical protein [Actinomycetospora sp. NBRC 106378]GLZ50580.1 hypothetical protein Acsp07_01970 [Actinomycetospora sp. NBRC 106378]